jgi:hypothetical protein
MNGRLRLPESRQRPCEEPPLDGLRLRKSERGATS